MRRIVLYTILACLPLVGMSQLLPNLGGQRAGISALTFLKIDPSVRSAGLAGANLTLTGDVFATSYNPAGLAEENDLSVGLSNTFWASGVNLSYLAASKSFSSGNFGLTIASLNSGPMERRTEFAPNGTGEIFYVSNTAVGVSYGRKLTDFFSFGGNIRYVNESIAEYTAHTAVVDLGFLYRVDFKDLSFAVLVQNFGTNSRLAGDFQPDGLNPKPVTLESYPAPTVFKVGVSIVPWKTEDMSLTTIAQLNHPNDNAENIRLGVEYEYRKLLYLRAGYKINVPDQTYPTAGIGLRTRLGKHPLHFDYAVDPTRYLGWIHRVGLRFNLNSSNRDEGGRE